MKLSSNRLVLCVSLLNFCGILLCACGGGGGASSNATPSIEQTATPARTPNPAVTYLPSNGVLEALASTILSGAITTNASPGAVSEGSATITSGGSTIPAAQTATTAVVLVPGEALTITGSVSGGYVLLSGVLNDDSASQPCITTTQVNEGTGVVFTVTAPAAAPAPCGIEGFVLYQSTTNQTAGLFTPIYVQVLPD